LDEGVRRTPVEVDLDEVVFEQTARTFRVPVDRSRVGAGRVVGVPQEFASVVRNLVDNATRHARSQVLVTLATVGPFVRLTVEDDGPGIAVSDRSRVFERFTRLEEGRTRDRGGSGLGLALCRRVVEASGGKIFIETSELGGASFVVELPALED
jgi:signal transduction histidine kinase